MAELKPAAHHGLARVYQHEVGHIYTPRDTKQTLIAVRAVGARFARRMFDVCHPIPIQRQRPLHKKWPAGDLRRARPHMRRRGRRNRATNPRRKRWPAVLAFIGFCLILIACDVAVIRCLPATAASFALVAGVVDFGFYLLGVIAALIFVHESFDGWWRKINCWQAFTAPIFFGIAWATASALHVQRTGLTAIGLAYGIGFITNPKVFRRLKDVLKFLIALRGGKDK